jgi:hypothetical protein
MMGPTVPYADLYGLFGVTLTSSAVAVHKMPVDMGGREQAVPQIDITTYLDTPITRSLNGLPSLFVIACPLAIAKTLPEGVTVEPLINLPVGPDFWADTNPFQAARGEAKRDEAEDIIPTEKEPVVLAAAATRKVGDAEQKAVLFGDAYFANDAVPNILYHTRVPRGQMYPGATELMTNSVLWVAGSEHLITVSPEAIRARRIGDLGDWSLSLEILIIGGLPAIVLAAGLVVWLVRRR